MPRRRSFFNRLLQERLGKTYISAYTPGKGPRRMEGGKETTLGGPIYYLEDYLAGRAPYVTGAIRGVPTGDTVEINVAGRTVPVKITDHGPGVHGIDLASKTRSWAKEFPFQGWTQVVSGNAPEPGTAPAPTPSEWNKPTQTAISYKRPFPESLLPGRISDPINREINRTAGTFVTGAGGKLTPYIPPAPALIAKTQVAYSPPPVSTA